MKTLNKIVALGLAGLCLSGWGWAQEAAAPVSEPAGREEPAAAASTADSPAATSAAPSAAAEPPVSEPPAEDVLPPAAAPSKPAKAAPTYRGADMGEAFQGAGSSRFGVSGRVNKMPAKSSPKKAKGDWKRSVEVGASTARGNSDILRYNAALSGSKETEENYFFLKAAGRYGESDGETDAESATGDAKYQRKLTERMYAALDGNARHDQLADLAYRARGSLSLGRHFVWTERTVLNAEIGPGYVAQKKGGETEGFMAGRAALYLEFLATDRLQLWHSAEFVQNLEDSAVYFINAEVGLETVLVSNLGLVFTVEDRYDSAPAEGKEGNDLLTTTALSWKF